MTRQHDAVYPALGANVASGLAQRLGAQTDRDGYLQVDEHGRTVVPGLYAIGDVVVGLNQISRATGQAATPLPPCATTGSMVPCSSASCRAAPCGVQLSSARGGELSQMRGPLVRRCPPRFLGQQLHDHPRNRSRRISCAMSTAPREAERRRQACGIRTR